MGNVYYTLYDRKSSRHNWQIITTTDNKKRLEFLAKHYQGIATTREGWDNYQQGTISFSEWQSNIEAVLPKNDPRINRIM